MMINTSTGISWTDTTLNPWVGCVPVSSGCLHCYAETLVTRDRGGVFGHPFNQVKLHLDRLKQLGKLGPIRDKETGQTRPRLIFVNSISDFFFEQVDDEAIHAALDAFEQYPRTVMQILTKRPIRARKMLTDRYGNSGIPANIWIGVSVESNEVAVRLKVLRDIRERTGGGGTFFASVEPIVGPTDKLDFTGLDWLITGGESGPGARIMQREWLMPPIEQSQRLGVRLWHKQSGTPWSHPNLSAAPAHLGIMARFQWLVDNGFEQLPKEKGGATVDRAVYRDLPLSFDQLAAKLSDSLI
jgi:protein gp37